MYYDPYRSEDQIPAAGYQVNDTQSAVPKGKKKRFWPKAVALILVCALVGGGAGVGGAALYSQMAGTTTTIYASDRVPTAVSVSHTNTGKKLSMEEIYASWVNSTVGITTQTTTNVFGQQVSSAAAGSGFVITQDGYIVTNYHVIDGATSVKVTFYDGTQYDATVVGGEEGNDVAVLKIEATGLTPVIIGDSDDLHVGESVTTIGNPLGELTFTQTAGIVSAKDRTITMSDGTRMNMIQTDCAINSGNSGGPLFNTYGEVIGITSAKYSNNGSSSQASIEGIGFAIPINDVVELIQDIIEYGYVTGKPNVGILMDTVDSDLQRYGIPAGVEILAVLDGSCADKAGIQAGDIITALGDTAITNRDELSDVVKSHRAGDTVTFTLYRNGETLTVSAVLDEDNETRSAAMDQLYTDYYNQQQQSQQQNQGGGYTWPFGGFSW